jgi:hypothetical protein
MNREEIQACINDNLSFVILLSKADAGLYEIVIDQSSYCYNKDWEPPGYSHWSDYLYFVLEDEFFKIIIPGRSSGLYHDGIEKMVRYKNIAGFFKFNKSDHHNNKADEVWEKIKKSMGG